MTDHLPECPVKPKGFTNRPVVIFGWTRVARPHPACICSQLQACRKRVLAEASDAMWALEDESCGCLGSYTIDRVAGSAIDAMRGEV